MIKYIKNYCLLLIISIFYIEASAQMGTCKSYLMPVYSSPTSFVIDGYGDKWMGTVGDGLLKFTNADSSWTIYTTSNSSLPSNYVNSIAIDSNGNKWIGTGAGGGLAKFDDTNWSVYNTSNSGLLYNNVVDLAIDGFGNKWISCKGTSPGTPVAMMKFDGISWTTVYSEMNNMYVYNMYIANGTVLWYNIYTNYASIIYKDCVTGTTAYYDNINSPMNSPNKIVVENNGTEWIAATNGLYKHYNSNWTNYNTGNSGIPSNSIYKLFLDSINNIWFTPTLISSIVRFDGSNWYSFDSSNTCFGTGKIRFLGFDSLNIWAVKWTDTTCFLVKISGLLSGIHYISQPINNFTIFPNPCNGAFTISYGALEPEIYIYNILGKLVYKKEKAAQGSEVIDISEYTKGIYFVKVQSGDKVYTDKVIIE